jgi:SAM-dependent methyltransferase
MINKKYKYLYKDDYFKNRKSNDIKRIESFALEKVFLKKNLPLEGNVCDIGCSTGEFLKSINWIGELYGTEVNDFAISTAKQNGIRFNKDIYNQIDFFDAVIFRGTIQHLPNPIDSIFAAFNSLKIGGKLIFLQTPNANSLVYKIANDLPMLDSKLNFFIPSDITLKNICNNVGFELLDLEFPYLQSPYRNILLDHLKFSLLLIGCQRPNFPFYKNVMNLIFIKK